MKTDEIDYKELCKQLFVITQSIFGITFVRPKTYREKDAALNHIHELVSEAYNLHAEATRKGLYK